jgi:hypothetical protein
MKHNLEDWLVEQDIPPAAANPDTVGATGGMMPPSGSPDQAGTNPGPSQDPNIANMQQQNFPANQQGQVDVTEDPQAPDMPEQKPNVTDFEVWKKQYFKESIKGDTNLLIELLNQVRDKDGLQPYQKKFIEDNMNVQLVRMNSNVEKASKEIRRNIRDQLDRNNPATSVTNHMTAVLETIPMLNSIFIKFNGYSGLKGDLHRKYIAALLGSVQVGSGANNEDLVYNEKDYSILISTRFNARWGDVMLGNWSLKEDDPERYLEEPELRRLQEGSPQEKDALRRRIVVESIAQLFETRAFLINVVDNDGTIYWLGWDIATSLRSAFVDGKLIVKTRHSENSEAMIDDDGKIVPLVDISINYVKETGTQDEDGMPEKQELEFMERRDGMLFLTADIDLIREASTALQGASFKEIPYVGNPSDLKTLMRCVYSFADLMLRTC